MKLIQTRIFVVALVLTAVSGSWAQLPPVPKDAEKKEKLPRLFVAKRKIELGKVLEGDKVQLEWSLENQGTGDLIISETKASCGCTIVKLTDDQKVAKPGATLSLKADFNSTQRFGNQVKAITVESNDPAEPKLQLEFTAEVEKTYELSPTVLNLRSVRRGVPAEKAITITPEGGRKSVEVVDISFAQPAPLTFVIEPIKTQTGNSGQKVVFTVTDDAALGGLIADAVVKIKIDGLERTAELPIRGEIVAELTWTPKVVDATRQSSPRGQQLQTVKVGSSEAKNFQITSATAGPLLNVAFAKVEGKEPKFDVNVTVRDDAPEGPFGATLEIHTTLPDQPVISVPVFGIVAPIIEVEPPLILLTQDGTPMGTKRRIKLQSAPQTELTIKNITSANDAVSVDWNNDADARLKHLRVLNVRLSGQLPKGTHESKLIVETAVPGAERFEIPVKIVVPG